MSIRKNLAISTVSVAPDPGGLTLTVQDPPSYFPDTFPFEATVWAVGKIPTPTNATIINVTGIDTHGVVTFTRQAGGSNDRTIAVGDQICESITIDQMSAIDYGTSDGVAVGMLPMFINTSQLALKMFYLGNWITLTAVSFDSEWNSVTDDWNSASMDWNSPV